MAAKNVQVKFGPEKRRFGGNMAFEREQGFAPVHLVYGCAVRWLCYSEEGTKGAGESA